MTRSCKNIQAFSLRPTVKDLGEIIHASPSRQTESIFEINGEKAMVTGDKFM